jgi:hypothetical protein
MSAVLPAVVRYIAGHGENCMATAALSALPPLMVPANPGGLPEGRGKPSEAVVEKRWRQGTIGGAKAHGFRWR